MATEKTRLLDSYIVDIPKDNDCKLTESDKTKGLSLEELMPFENDPWWQNLRKTFFLSYWITVIVIFITACILSIIGNNSCHNNIGIKTLNGSKQMPAAIVKEFFQTITTSKNLIQNIERNIKNISIMTTEKIIDHTSKLQ